MYSGDNTKKTLYIKTVLALIISITLGYALYISVFMSSSKELHPVDINSLNEGEWKKTYPLETYIDGPEYLKTEILKDTTNKKFVRLRTVTSSDVYSGINFYINKQVPENANLILKWRCSNDTTAIIIDVMDGSKMYDLGIGDSTFDFGENFFVESLSPDRMWGSSIFPLDSLILNPSQPTERTLDGIFDFNKVRRVSISISPNSDLTLDIKEIYFYWKTEKWLLVSALLIISLTGTFLFFRTKQDKLFLERGTTFNTKALIPRIIYCLIAFSAFIAVIIYGPLFLTASNLAVFAILLILVIVDELVVFIKPHALWSMRYAIVFFCGNFLGFSGGVLSVCLILMASYVPLILLEKLRGIFWVVVITALLGYIAKPIHESSFSFVTGLIMVLSSTAVAIILRGYLLQQHRDFILGQAILQYEALFKKTSDAIYVLNESGIILTVNQSFERLTGYSQSELKGWHITKFICPESKETVKIMLMANDETDFKQYDIHFANKDGQVRTALVRCSTIFKDKHITGYQALATDITERKLAEEKLELTVALLEKKADELAELNNLMKVSEERLRELNASKDRFFSIISHDLRNPFHSVMGLSSLLASDYKSLTGEEISTFAAHINANVENIYKLLENLLQWANIQNGKMVYSFTDLNLFELVEIVIGVVKGNAERKNIQIYNNTPKDTFVYADFNSIHSVIQNLITNAIKFTNSGGQVTITSKIKEEMVEIIVADNGIGMSSEDLKKLFKIGVHHSTEGTANELGTGLGLILCKEMIEHNGGEINSESEPGKGSRFIFTLPDYGSISEKQVKDNIL